MKVFYFNDTNRIVRVHLHSLHFIAKVLNPAEGAQFDIGAIADDQSVFVKVWPSCVLIGRTDSPIGGE